MRILFVAIMQRAPLQILSLVLLSREYQLQCPFPLSKMFQVHTLAHLHCQSFTSLLRSCSMSLCVSSSVAVLTFVVGSFSFETIKVQTKLLFFFRGFIQDNATYYPSKECRRHREITFKNAIYRCFFTNFIYIYLLCFVPSASSSEVKLIFLPRL